MKQEQLHPYTPWIWWVLVLPGLALVVGVASVALTNLGDMPFDNGDLWWVGGAIPLTSLAFLYATARRKRALRRFAKDQLAVLLATRTSPSRMAIRAGFFVLALVATVAAILGPRWGTFMEKQKVRGIDVVVALDLSRSMLAKDLMPNRLEQAKLQIQHQLVDRAIFKRANRLGLLVFAGTTSLRVPLTTDHLAFKSQLQSVHYGSITRGGTAIASAITAATDLFDRSPETATKIILLFTDGEDHEGDPVAAAQLAQVEKGIRVFTVGVGDPAKSAGAEVPTGKSGDRTPLLHSGQIVFSKLDVDTLQKMAEAGSGRYANLSELHLLVNEMASMWKANLTTEERERHIPRYQWFLAAALVLLGLSTMIRESNNEPAERPKRTWQMEMAN